MKSSFSLILFFGLLLFGGHVLSQSSSMVKVSYSLITDEHVCRYCEAKGYEKYIRNITIKNPNDKVKYQEAAERVIEMKINKSDFRVSVFGTSGYFDSFYKQLKKSLPNECDISRTRRHGIEDESFSEEKEISLTKTELEENISLYDDMMRKETIRKELNANMTLYLDSFNITFNNVVSNKDKNDVNKLWSYYQKIVMYLSKKDGADKLSYTSWITVEDRDPLESFGKRLPPVKGFSVDLLTSKYLIALLSIGNNEGAFRMIKDYESQSLKTRNLFLVKGMAHLIEGEFSNSATAFVEGNTLTKSSFPELCNDVSDLVTSFRDYLPDNKNLKSFGMIKLQLALAKYGCSCQFPL